jgi:uncharacterized protein (DUF1015 family)
MAPSPTAVPRPDGLVLAPFRAVRYALGPGEDLAPLTTPPYDVIDDAAVAGYEAADPRNAVRLILPRDLPADGPGAPAPRPDGVTPGAGSRYPRAAATMRLWLSEGVLRRDRMPALYVYEETDHGHVQRGLVGAVAVADPEAGIILPHENTMAGPVTDRLALTEATGANLEPIFLLYDGGGATSRLVAQTTQLPPLIDTTTDDGVHHRLWAITDPDQLTEIAADLAPRRAVIADGHHRYATYRHHQADRHAAGDGPGPWDYGLAFLADATAAGPRVHAIHRVIADLPVAAAARLAGAGFRVHPLVDPGDAAGQRLLDELAKAGQDGHAFVVTDGAAAYLLTDPSPELLAAALPADRSEAFRGLDVTVAHLFLIARLWQLADREGVVDYRHDAASAIAAAAGTGGTALLLNPTPVAAVAAVAAAGERMPRKSTLFTPKPRTGLLFRPLES